MHISLNIRLADVAGNRAIVFQVLMFSGSYVRHLNTNVCTSKCRKDWYWKWLNLLLQQFLTAVSDHNEPDYCYFPQASGCDVFVLYKKTITDVCLVQWDMTLMKQHRPHGSCFPLGYKKQGLMMCALCLSVGSSCMIQVNVYVFMMSNLYRCHGYKQTKYNGRQIANNCTCASFPVLICFASLLHSFQFQLELWPVFIQRVKSFSNTNQCICCIL